MASTIAYCWSEERPIWPMVSDAIPRTAKIVQAPASSPADAVTAELAAMNGWVLLKSMNPSKCGRGRILDLRPIWGVWADQWALVQYW
jgi:hypothetical protein